MKKIDNLVFYENSTVMITGACGTVGLEIINQLLIYNVKKIIAIDNNETALFFNGMRHADHKNIIFIFCDIRNKDELSKKMYDVDYVIHCASLKHVPVCEISPQDAVLTNIQGSLNVIDAALHNEVKKVIFTSTDKAVNPKSPFIPSIRFMPFMNTKIENVKKIILIG